MIAEPEVSFGNGGCKTVGGGFLPDNLGSLYPRTCTGAADCTDGDHRHSNRKPDQSRGAVVLHDDVPNAIEAAYRRGRL